MNVAVIPARGGSKRLAGKNIRVFCGKPIIAYGIEAALQSRLFDLVIVSTDCKDIKKLAESYGATVPFLRPDCLADDHTPLIPVITHAIDWVEKNLAIPKYACCIFATAPFIQAKFLLDGRRLLEQNPEADFAIACTSYAFPVQRALRLDGKYLNLMSPEYELTRSQDLPEAYHDAGQFYWGKSTAFRNNKWVISNTLPVMLPRWLVQDIDTEEDWEAAEALMKISIREK